MPDWGIAVLASTVVLASPSEGPGPTGEAIIEAEEAFRQSLFSRLAPSVVFLSSGSGFGSGFFVTDDGLVLTNAHVVGAAGTVQVVLRDGRSLKGRVVERAGDIDLALVEVPVAKSKSIPLASADRLRVGAWVASIGHGKGAVWTFNVGIVSNIYPSGTTRPVFQTQIPLNSGSSGGPIVDRHGRVVGIVTAGMTAANSINFGIKIDVALRTLPKLATRCACLRIRAPRDVAVHVNGVLVGVGPLIILPMDAAFTRASAVIDGELVRRRIIPGKTREIWLRASTAR